MELNPVIYNSLIDPLLNSLRKRIVRLAEKDSRILDIACGTGELVREFAGNETKVTGVDLDPKMINYARKRLKGDGNQLSFMEADARNLYMFEDESFDTCTMSLALHQFDPDDWDTILAECFRVSSRLIIADYSHPLPAGFKKNVVHIVERIAGKEHYRNFRAFMKEGGILGIAGKNSLRCVENEISGSGIFSVYVLEKS